MTGLSCAVCWTFPSSPEMVSFIPRCLAVNLRIACLQSSILMGGQPPEMTLMFYSTQGSEVGVARSVLTGRGGPCVLGWAPRGWVQGVCEGIQAPWKQLACDCGCCRRCVEALALAWVPSQECAGCTHGLSSAEWPRLDGEYGGMQVLCTGTDNAVRTKSELKRAVTPATTCWGKPASSNCR